MDALRQTRDAGEDTIFFVGGEPTLHPQLFDLVRTAHSLGFASIGLQTNGRRLASENLVQDLVENGLTMVDISMMGSDAACHDYHTGIPGSFDETTRGIEAAVSTSLEVGITAVVTRSNYRGLGSIVERAHSLGVRALHLTFPRAEGRAGQNFLSVVPRFQMVLPHLSKAARISRARGLPVVVSGAPLCVMGGSASASLETQSGWKTESHLVDACEGCSLAPICPGLGPAYVTRFGSSELIPVTVSADAVRVSAQRFTPAAGLFAGLGQVESREDG
jgi:hypothetical protein